MFNVGFMFDFSSVSLSFVVLFVFLGGWVSTYFFRKQFLLSLLSLEILVLSLFLGYMVLLLVLGKPVCFTLYLLVLGACEATLGLCLLVSFVRLVGSDMLSKFMFLKC